MAGKSAKLLAEFCSNLAMFIRYQPFSGCACWEHGQSHGSAAQVVVQSEHAREPDRGWVLVVSKYSYLGTAARPLIGPEQHIVAVGGALPGDELCLAKKASNERGRSEQLLVRYGRPVANVRQGPAVGSLSSTSEILEVGRVDRLQNIFEDERHDERMKDAFGPEVYPTAVGLRLLRHE